MALYETASSRLDRLIQDSLQPDAAFLGQVGRAVHEVCAFLREQCFAARPPPRPRVLKVVKGGSSGKGTALRGRSDADLVVFLSCFKGYKDQEENRTEIIWEIRRMLEKCQQEKRFEVIIEVSRWENPRVLSFQLRSRMLEESIDFDVLPAYDPLGQHVSGYKPSPDVYLDLIGSCSRGGEFSTCFTELQRDFVMDRPTKVKSLIRLVKHWYKKYVRPYKAQLRQGESLPPQYALELLTIYTWEKGSGETDFSMAKGFRTVLELIQQYEQLCVFWTINYGFEDEALGQYLQSQLRKRRPLILDPADPTGIVGEGCRWDLIAEEAKFCCIQRCCVDTYGVPVQPWDVSPEQTLKGSKGVCVRSVAKHEARKQKAAELQPVLVSSYSIPALAPQELEKQPSFCSIL
ncbi:2'-5'-oligoadenylate synthase 3 isoform X1 [Alligator mississippiensis]|uniref:2'-5'-oligoadenylate synthase 1 n=1 Tax=Alligator mississippiensis TaxID=8496 RepID=A0A151NE69_ALLMI|nr:2'-5'-oligoadenylate synthase 3-like isoform X1 [Alligator mississippiensis]XP_059569606.1 2'-5'-oligoadenylate synthase 3 isoform X1 [Alligator mississippiensis]KYO34835.1 2'-5'-oligoadenylate synthase 1 [Alligator mississippiensis]